MNDQYVEHPERFWPHDPRSVATALGVPAIRIDILNVLRGDDATLPQIAAVLGWTRNGLQSHVDVLEELGAITHRTERVSGSYRPTRRYRIDPDRVDAIGWCLYDAVTEHDQEVDGP